MPQKIQDAMKDWTDTNIAEAKRNALGDLLGYPREFQKDIAAFLDKVIFDAEDIARWENMPPDVQQAFQPDLKEKKESLQWLEDGLAQQDGQNSVVSDSQGESVETLAKRYGVEYTDTERYGLLERYHQSVTKGILSPLVDFPLYEDYYQKIQDRAIGQVVNGVEITEQSQHFLERVFGCMQDPGTKRPRNGVALEDVFDCIENPVKIGPTKIGKDGKPSFAVEGRNVRITVNPDTGTLIQVNPWG